MPGLAFSYSALTFFMSWSIWVNAPNFSYATVMVLLPPDEPLLEQATSELTAVAAATMAVKTLARIIRLSPSRL